MENRSSTLEDNLALLMERFPKLGLLAPSWPLAACVREELTGVDPGKAEALYVYGLGRGAPYVQLRDWLRQDAARRLIVLEDDLGSIKTWLHDPDAREVLQDSQVHLSLKDEWHTLAEQFPLRRIEVVALPSRNRPRFRALRLKLLRTTTLSHALHLDRLHGYQPMQNFVRNLRHLPNSFYANRLQNSFKGVPAIVCGAGPSLQPAIPHLKQLENKALLIAGGSTIAALSSQGVLPHFGMAIDPNLEEYRRMRNSFAFEMPLLYSTRVCPLIFQTCNGPFGYMRSGIGGVPELWMEEELGLLDPLIGDHLSHESISVTAICTAWAQFLGCNPILFSGVDLAYTGNKRYADGVTEEEEIPFALLDAEKSAADRILKRKDRHGHPIFTATRWIMESASLAHFAKKHPEIQFINTTDGGLGIQGIPFMPLVEAVESFNARDLRAQVYAQIANASMPPNAAAIIESKMEELRKSLARVVAHLEVLVGKRPGSKPLAEVELQDEMAMHILFYDSRQLFGAQWEPFLDLAMKYTQTI